LQVKWKKKQNYILNNGLIIIISGNNK
jgi:hypothetical protein